MSGCTFGSTSLSFMRGFGGGGVDCGMRRIALVNYSALILVVGRVEPPGFDPGTSALPG